MGSVRARASAWAVSPHVSTTRSASTRAARIEGNRVSAPIMTLSLTERLPKGLTSWKRSEEHTSELQSLAYLVCRLLLEEKHTSELQSLAYLVCRLLLEKKNTEECRAQQPLQTSLV